MVDGAEGAGEERGLVIGEDVPVGTVYGGGGGEDGVIQRRQESDGGQVERRGGLGGTGIMVRNVVAPLVLRPSRRRGLGTFRVSFYPLKSVSAGHMPFTVLEEGET